MEVDALVNEYYDLSAKFRQAYDSGNMDAARKYDSKMTNLTHSKKWKQFEEERKFPFGFIHY